MANTRKRIGALILAIVMAFSVIIPTVAVEIASDSHPFTDVREGAWYHGYVLFVSNANLKNGTGATTFSPHLATSRAMVATVLYRMAGSPGTEGITNPFDDVALGTWYTDAVIWAADNGIVNGVGSGRFAPHLDITRQDLAAMMARYAAFEGFELSAQRTYTGFADSGDIAVHAYTAVQALFEAGVINGHPDNRFAPLANALRAEFAAMLTRFVTNAGFSAFLNGESSQDGAVEGSPEQRDDASAGWQAGNQNGGPGGG
ncbi:MAG: S-layer homology domain-containing protein, partial [Oscillospiraceae bacterium]|nr:S-layer homology domain-containing protein [Oscillospiraceae bacterium]